MKIIIDMDSTLTDCTTPWLEKINRIHRTEFKKEELFDFHALGKLLAKTYNVPEEIGKEMAEAPLYKKGFFQKQLPNANAINSVNELIEVYNDTIIIGTKPPFSSQYAYTEKFYWIQNHFPKHKEKIKFIGTADKDYIIGDILIDDNILNLQRSKGIHKTVRFYQEWNSTYDDADYTVHSWNEFMELRKKL